MKMLSMLTDQDSKMMDLLENMSRMNEITKVTSSRTKYIGLRIYLYLPHDYIKHLLESVICIKHKKSCSWLVNFR